MKQLLTTYTLNTASRVVTLTGVNVPLSQVLLIAAKGRVLYSLADGLGAANYTQGASSALTLQASAVQGLGLADDTPLTIFYEDGAAPASEAGLQAVEDAVASLSAKVTEVDTSQVSLSATDRALLDAAATPATQEVAGTVDVGNLPADLATATLQGTANTSLAGIRTDLGTDGAAPPTIAGTGVRGWLRGIFERLSGTLTVSGTVTANTGLSQPLTDTQLRASAVPVSGPLTDTQLRASAVPVSLSSAPLPSGAATAAAQATGNTSLSSIDAKLPALAAGKVPVDVSFPATQAVSGPLTDTQLRASAVPVSLSSAPLPAGAASEATLVQVRTALQAFVSVASSVWTDNSGAYYVRRDVVDQDAGTVSVAWTDATGGAATPGAGLRPAGNDRELRETLFDVITSGTGYTAGDLVARVTVIDASTTTPSVLTTLWLNITAGTTLASAPTAAHLERADETIGARQIGAWSVSVSNQPADPATATLQGTANTSLAGIRTDLGTDGAAPPTIAGTGVRGWLRGIFERLSGTLTVSGTVTANTGLSQPLTDTQLRASAVQVDTGLTPLTDTQLRASAVPVTGPLTNTQLRASAVHVDTGLMPLTDTQLRASAVPVTGPLTDAQLRASAVPVSLSSAPLPAGAASEATLVQVRTALQAFVSVASSVWTDNSGAYYVRRDVVDQDAGTFTVVWTDATGGAATPGAGLRPAGNDRELRETLFDVITSGTGYTAGDLVARVTIIDASTSTPSVLTTLWLNITAGTTLASAPTAAHLERADETIGARQIGAWSVSVSNQPADPATATLQGTANTSLAGIRTDLGTDGAAPPTIAGTGVRGWLRGIFERLSGSLTVSGTVTANTGLSQPLTDTQLRASAVPVSVAGVATAANQATTNTSLANIDGDLGATADAAASSDTGTFSLIALVKRALQNWTTLLARVPTLGQKNKAGSIPVTMASDQGVTQTAALTTSSTTGTVAAGAASVSFFNRGGANATVAGGALPPGETVTFSADWPNTLGSISYTATGTTLAIATVV